MRVYLPSTLPELAHTWAGTVASAGARAYAVTPALREWYRQGDLDELEDVALRRAALASLRLLAAQLSADLAPQPSVQPDADGAGHFRRVVLAIDVADGAVEVRVGAADPAEVMVMAAIVARDVVSAHVDDDAAVQQIREAAACVHAADAGDDDAAFTVDGLDDHELAWFAAQEIPYLFG